MWLHAILQQDGLRQSIECKPFNITNYLVQDATSVHTIHSHISLMSFRCSVHRLVIESHFSGVVTLRICQ